MSEKVGGVVLAGGQSRRMGGGDKGLLDVAGESMISRVINRLKPQVSAMVINANGSPSRFADFDLPIVADPIEGYVGPLAGVLAGMRWAGRMHPNLTHIVTVSSDAPFFPCDLVGRLIGGRPESATSAIVLAASNGQKHPVIGLWPVHLADDLEGALKDGIRKVLQWTDRHGTVVVDFDPEQIGSKTVDPFFNANTPEELEEARTLLRTET